MTAEQPCPCWVEDNGIHRMIQGQLLLLLSGGQEITPWWPSVLAQHLQVYCGCDNFQIHFTGKFNCLSIPSIRMQSPADSGYSNVFEECLLIPDISHVGCTFDLNSPTGSQCLNQANSISIGLRTHLNVCHSVAPMLGGIEYGQHTWPVNWSHKCATKASYS